MRLTTAPMGVREQPAPSGALRPLGCRGPRSPGRGVREHPAPSGALRRCEVGAEFVAGPRQGAPSTIRCIKTADVVHFEVPSLLRQGAPSTIRCIKTHGSKELGLIGKDMSGSTQSTIRCIKTGKHSRSVQRSKSSGSTQHHQVRSRLCSIGAGRGPQPECQGVEACRCCGGASCGRAVSGPPAPFCCEVRTQGARNRQRRSHTRAGSSRCARRCAA